MILRAPLQGKQVQAKKAGAGAKRKGSSRMGAAAKQPAAKAAEDEVRLLVLLLLPDHQLSDFLRRIWAHSSCSICSHRWSMPVIGHFELDPSRGGCRGRRLYMRCLRKLREQPARLQHVSRMTTEFPLSSVSNRSGLLVELRLRYYEELTGILGRGRSLICMWTSGAVRHVGLTCCVPCPPCRVQILRCLERQDI